MTNLDPWSSTLITLSSHDLINFKDFFSSLFSLLLAILKFSWLKSYFSIFSMNFSQILYLVSVVQYNGRIVDSGFLGTIYTSIYSNVISCIRICFKTVSSFKTKLINEFIEIFSHFIPLTSDGV